MPLMMRPSLFNTLAIGMKPAYSVVAGDGPPRIKSDSSGRSHPTGSKSTQLTRCKETLMNVLRRNLCLMGIALLCATASFAQHVKTDYDRSVDFSQYTTYTWEHVHTQNPLWVDRIKAAVNSALAAKGWTEVESGGSVSIVGMEVTRSHQTLDTYYDGFGGGWRWRGWGNQFGEATTTTNTYEVGTLVVDLFDSRTKKV